MCLDHANEKRLNEPFIPVNVYINVAKHACFIGNIVHICTMCGSCSANTYTTARTSNAKHALQESIAKHCIYTQTFESELNSITPSTYRIYFSVRKSIHFN